MWISGENSGVSVEESPSPVSGIDTHKFPVIPRESVYPKATNNSHSCSSLRNIDIHRVIHSFHSC